MSARLQNGTMHCCGWSGGRKHWLNARELISSGISHTSTGRHALKLNITAKIQLGEGHLFYYPSFIIKINQA